MFPASITIPAGATTASVTVQVVDDNIAEEFERAAIVLGHLPRGWHPAPHRLPPTRNPDPDDPGSPGVYFDIAPSDVADIGRLRFRVCERADNSCPVGGDDGWVETTTPSLTLQEGGPPKSYQYRLTPALTAFREVEVSPGHSKIPTNGISVDRDRLICVGTADHSVPPLSTLTVLPGDVPSQCPHRPRSYGGDQIDTWRTVTYRAGSDADSSDHSVTVRHRTLARITGHPYAGHYYQDPSGERWPVRLNIIDDDRPDQDVEFNGNGSGWIAMNDGGGVDSALPDVLVPGQTYSFQVRLRDRTSSAQRDGTHFIKLRSHSHARDVRMSMTWNTGAEDAQWYQRLDFRFDSTWQRTYTVRVHVAADAAAGNVMFEEYTDPGFWSRAADLGSQNHRHHFYGAVARIEPHVADRHRSHNAPVDNAPLIAEVNGHITNFTSSGNTVAVRDWNLILDRLEGRPGMRDSDIQVWLNTARFRNWQDAITTLPKVQTALAAAGLPVADDDDGPISDSDDAPVSDSNDAPVGDSNDARLDEAALVAEVKAHIADFTSRNHANGVRDWNLILDRLQGRTGMSDADIAVWHERSVRHGWQDGVTTLPKVQAALAAPQPVVVPEVNITGSVGGTEGADVSFTVSAVPPPAADLAVSVAVSASGDFGVLTGSHTVTIPAGQSSATLTVSTSDDSVDEPDGSVTLTLNSGGGYTVGSLSSQSVQVLDDDDAPQVAAPVVSVTAGAGVAEGGSALFTVSADAAPAADLPVSVTVAASGDFGVVTGSRTVTIAAGTTSKAFSVATSDDSVDEANGSVTVTVVDGADYDVGTAVATVSVADDDDPPPENVPDTDDVPDQNSVDPNQPVEVPDTDQVPLDGDACTGKPTVAAADATAPRGDDLEFVISLDCTYSSDVDVYYTIAHGLTYADGGSVTISSGDTTATVLAPTIGASDVGLYLVWVTEVTNPSGIWAYGTITD